MINKVILAIMLLSMSYTSLSSTLKLSTFNIKNYNYDSRTGKYTDDALLIRIIDSLEADLIAVQEIVNSKLFVELITKSFKRYKVVMTNCGGTGRQKLGFIYDRYKLALKSFTEWKELSGSTSCHSGLRPGAVARFKSLRDESEFIAVGVHLKAGASTYSQAIRKLQHNQISNFINSIERQYSNVVVIGDFNTTDNLNGSDFLDFISENNFYNYSQHIDCSSYWWGGIDDGLYHGGLLDHILVSKSFHSSFTDFAVSVDGHCKVNRCDAVPKHLLGNTFSSVSDHCPVSVALTTN